MTKKVKKPSRGRVAIPRPGHRHPDRKKQAAKEAARKWRLEE